MTSLPIIKSFTSLNKSGSKANLLLELNKSSSKANLLELNKSSSKANLGSFTESENIVSENEEIISDNNLMYFSEQKIFEETPWVPPSRNGLRNSEPIIPSYYLKKFITENVEYINIDYKTIIMDDIRNFRKLNDQQIKYIKTHIDNKTKNEIIDELIKALDICIFALNT